MKLREITLSISLLLLIFTISCEKEIAQNDHKHKHSSNATVSNNVQVVDGVPIMEASGSMIERDKVFEMLEGVDLSFGKLASPDATEGELDKSIKKLNQLLLNEEVSSDSELKFIVHNMLTSSYLRLYDLTNQNDLLNKASDHANTAISIFKTQPEYKADLAQAYSGLLATLSLKQEYGEAIPIMKSLIKDYQNIGYGPFKNWFASDQVQWLHSLSGKEDLEPEMKEDIISYISATADNYNNEVGITAQITLAHHQIRKDGLSKTKPLFDSIESRVAALDNPAFKKQVWEPFKKYVKAQNNVNSHHHD